MRKKKPKYEYVGTGRYLFHITVYHRDYGSCEYFIPEELALWLKERGLHASYTHGGSWGNGYDANGITTQESNYMVSNADETDGLAFKIQFAKCKVHISEQMELRCVERS